MRKTAIALIIAMALPVGGAIAQDSTLADIRAELTQLYVDVQNVRAELVASGAAATGAAGNTPLERLTSIESELQRLTSMSEQLEFRVNRIVRDGTNRIGDLEFRLCELEDGCDIGALGETPSLGGVDAESSAPPAVDAPAQGSGPALAIGEQSDFERAQEALASGNFRSAADQFAAFNEAYPGGPLTAKAHYGRGAALEALGQTTDAARAYLDAFSTAPEGSQAPDALYKLGNSLGALGQTTDACITLGEVGMRFPGNGAVLEAQATMRNLGCQ